MNIDFQSKMVAAVGAVAVTMMLLVSSFANPHATSIAGLLA